MKHRVFVYGTLKRGHANHDYLDGARYLSPGETELSYTVVSAGFPIALYPRAGYGKAPVRGEVYEVDGSHLRALDRLEAVGRMYLRTIVPVATPTGTWRALMYVGNDLYWNNPSEYRELPITEGVYVF